MKELFSKLFFIKDNGLNIQINRRKDPKHSTNMQAVNKSVNLKFLLKIEIIE
jgi:hypothetical protein